MIIGFKVHHTYSTNPDPVFHFSNVENESDRVEFRRYYKNWESWLSDQENDVLYNMIGGDSGGKFMAKHGEPVPKFDREYPELFYN